MAMSGMATTRSPARVLRSARTSRRAADHAGFALLVDETGGAGRAAVTNAGPNMAGFDPTDDVRELNRSASDAEEDHGRVALGELGNYRWERWQHSLPSVTAAARSTMTFPGS